ncbi:hypothetical protein PGIGA_G00078020 [Pangasianodon gigas]|uniref:Uncharacterized protein n=1 Tax=Pangasianodon gigas TaxID=30993 RepID=A0ACC5X9G4_PANGG|nr:hypothetical protein [Pangasianodon gigas]
MELSNRTDVNELQRETRAAALTDRMFSNTSKRSEIGPFCQSNENKALNSKLDDTRTLEVLLSKANITLLWPQASESLLTKCFLHV